MDENIFESGLAHAERLDFSRECLYDFGNEVVSIFNFEAHTLVHDGGIDLKLSANAIGQRLWIAGLQQNYIASNFAGQGFGRSERYQVAFVQDGEAVAALGFFHQMGGDDD